MLFAPNRYVSILFLLLALMSMSCTSALLWSIYIPSLGKTGKVSSVNGILDCTGYVAAALANLLFANVMANVGWNTVFVLWASLGVIGITSTLFVRNKKSA
jgi:sugar phosphate permease